MAEIRNRQWCRVTMRKTGAVSWRMLHSADELMRAGMCADLPPPEHSVWASSSYPQCSAGDDKLIKKRCWFGLIITSGWSHCGKAGRTSWWDCGRAALLSWRSGSKKGEAEVPRSFRGAPTPTPNALPLGSSLKPPPPSVAPGDISFNTWDFRRPLRSKVQYAQICAYWNNKIHSELHQNCKELSYSDDSYLCSVTLSWWLCRILWLLSASQSMLRMSNAWSPDDHFHRGAHINGECGGEFTLHSHVSAAPTSLVLYYYLFFLQSLMLRNDFSKG